MQKLFLASEANFHCYGLGEDSIGAELILLITFIWDADSTQEVIYDGEKWLLLQPDLPSCFTATE